MKLQALKEILASMKSVLVAYSGGADSTLLLKVAKDVLGDNAAAVIAASLTYPGHEIEAAQKTAGALGAKLIVIHTDELSRRSFTENSPQRCYWCKKELFTQLSSLAREYGLAWVVDGANHDDLQDFRPGMKAARELGVRSPLQEAGLTKDEIRSLSRDLGLPTWSKPSLACLASRFPYGLEITPEGLERVAAAESFLRAQGILQLRVRHHNETARIEVLENDMPKLLEPDMRARLVAHFKSLGYTYITLDLAGFRTGSMNEVLGRPKD